MNMLTVMDEMEEASKQTYCSMSIDTDEDRKKLYNVLGNSDTRVVDHLDEVIALKDVVLQKFPKADEETGEITYSHRVILIDKDNKTYASGSRGLYRSIIQLIQVIGEPHNWSTPVNIKVLETNIKNGGKTFIIKTI